MVPSSISELEKPRRKSGASPERQVKRGTRINFISTQELDERLSLVADAVGASKSEVIRDAIKEYITKVEKAMVCKELEEGYIANYATLARSNQEWEAADLE